MEKCEKCGCENAKCYYNTQLLCKVCFVGVKYPDADKQKIRRIMVRNRIKPPESLV